MSTEEADIPQEEEHRTWSDRLVEAAVSARALLSVRLQIFREELAGKAASAAKGLLAIAVAVLLGAGVLLLLAALLAAIFAKLFGSMILGILVAAILYAAGAGAAAWRGWKALSSVKPGSFPATGEELASDWKAVRASLFPGAEAGGGADGTEGRGSDEGDVHDLERRLREGSE